MLQSDCNCVGDCLDNNEELTVKVASELSKPDSWDKHCLAGEGREQEREFSHLTSRLFLLGGLGI